MIILVSSDRVGQLALQIVHINLFRGRMLDDAHQGSLQVFDILPLRHELGEIFGNASLGKLELIVVILQLSVHVFKLLDLPVCEVKFLFGLFDICYHVGMGLVCSVHQALLQLHVGLQVVDRGLVGAQLFLQGFVLFLLCLKPICQEKRLLDSSLGSCGSTCNGLNESITNCISTIFFNSRTTSYIHNGGIEFFLYHFIIVKPLSCNGQLRFDIRAAFSGGRLQLVELGLENIHLLSQGFILHFALFHDNHIVFI